MSIEFQNRKTPRDEILNALQLRREPVRWNIDQRSLKERSIYPSVSNPILEEPYVIKAPRLEDPRVVELYYDVHPDEKEQGLIGRFFEQYKQDGVTSRQINRVAQPGKRQHKYNMNLIFPGDPNDRENREIRLAHTVLELAHLWNPDVAFELHNTPLPDDAMLFMRRDVGRYVGRVAAYLSRAYELPIVEAPETSLSGSFGRSILVEMPLGDPRFSLDVWRIFLNDLVHNRIPLPRTPTKPQYTFYSDMTAADWLGAGQSPDPRPSFSPIEDDVATRLSLPLGSRAVNWNGVSSTNPYIGAVVTPFSEDASQNVNEVVNLRY